MARKLSAARLREGTRRQIRTGYCRSRAKRYRRERRTCLRVQRAQSLRPQFFDAKRIRPARGRLPVRMEFSGTVEPRFRTRPADRIRYRMERIHCRATRELAAQQAPYTVRIPRPVRLELQPRHRAERRMGRQGRRILYATDRQRPKIQRHDASRESFGSQDDRDRQSGRVGRRGALFRFLQRKYDAPEPQRTRRHALYEQHRPQRHCRSESSPRQRQPLFLRRNSRQTDPVDRPQLDDAVH